MIITIIVCCIIISLRMKYPHYANKIGDKYIAFHETENVLSDTHITPL